MSKYYVNLLSENIDAEELLLNTLCLLNGQAAPLLQSNGDGAQLDLDEAMAAIKIMMLLK